MSQASAITTEEALDQVLTTPRPVLVEFMKTVRSPLVILGGGGKMGPTLAVLARRAADEAGHALEVISASRFSNDSTRAWLEQRGIRTIRVDLLDRHAYASLPDSTSVVYLAGLKFGTIDRPALTWATNTLIPSFTCERYPRARIAALSSGNVYPLSRADGPGSLETDPLEPLGEYSNSCVARERIFEYYAQANGTPVALIRLSYAVDLRYGVLHDIARNVLAGSPVSLRNDSLNFIWQGDANEFILRSLAVAQSPALPINLTGTRWHPVRELAERFADLFGKPARFSGSESGIALLSSTRRMQETLGTPPTSTEDMIRWTAGWLLAGGRSLNKPTHYEVSDGKY